MRIAASFLFFLLVFSACREKDSVAPDVTILQPQDGAVFSVFDTVFVTITAVDETDLASVSARLVNADFIPIGTSVNVNVNSSTNGGGAELIIDNKLTDTGDYYILITAKDGTNEQREFRKIRISGLPKKRRAVYFSSTNGGESDAVSRLDSLFQNSALWLQADQDIRKICVNSLNDRLTFIGYLSTGICSYNIDFLSLSWSDDIFQAAQTERYFDLACSENDVFAAIYDREVRGYNLSGGLIMNQPTGNYRPETIFSEGNYLVVEMEFVGDDDHFIFVYQRQTRVLLWQLDVPMDVISICKLQNDEVLLFGNDGGDAKVLHYDIGDNVYWQPRQLPEGRLLGAVSLEGQRFAIAHENGLYAYTYSPNYLNLIRGGITHQQLCFDVDKGTILGASENILEEVSLNGQLLNTVVHSDSITSIAIHYTR
jgi:hypothetical protein